MSLLNSFVASSLPYIPKFIVGQVSKRYIAGTRLSDALETIRSLNARGFMATLDLLGEDLTEAAQTVETREAIVEMFRSIAAERLDSNVSIKPTQLGLRIDRELCFSNIRSIVEMAREVGNFVRIDMEDSTTTDATLEIYYRLRSEGFTNVGVVIQAYLKRSEDDVRALVKAGANVRLCKGIYLEPAAIAFHDREVVRENFMKLLTMMVDGGSYVGIATHDDVLVERSYVLIDARKLGRERYEFQMLLGVRELLRESILKRGHRLRVYVPFGERWYAYSVRRLKENPHLAGYVFKAMFRGGG